MRNNTSIDRTKSAHRWRALGALVFAGLLLAALAGTSAAAAAKPAAGSAPSPSGSSGAVVIKTKTGPAGTYLTDGTGKSLYLFVIDTATKSMCNGPCAKAWPPLTSTGKATADTGVKSAELTMIKRDDGSMQVAYNGHPLYFFEGDTSPGSTAGQGVNAFGGLWWLVSPKGEAITTSGGGSAAPSAPSSGAPSAPSSGAPSAPSSGAPSAPAPSAPAPGAS